MKLLNKLTIKNLKLNKKRTIVTIIGILLSVSLITAVASIYSSAIASLIDFETTEKGNFHVVFYDVPKEDIKIFENNRQIEELYLTKDIGYAKLEESKNEYKPYAFVKAFSQEGLENLSITLVEGRLPQNSDEIVIPTHLKTNGRVTMHVGDSITLDIGKRIGEDGVELKQSNPFQSVESEGIIQNLDIVENHPSIEQIVDTTSKTYKIVGIIQRPASNIESYVAPGYTFITYLDEQNEFKNLDKNVDIYARYTKEGTKNAYKVTANILGVDENLFEKFNASSASYETGKNSEYDTYVAQMNNAKYKININSYLIGLQTDPIGSSAIGGLGIVVAIVCAIIVFTSVFCIKNSFDISITEKIRQYGMLRSIGATKKQIKKNVFYEASLLGIIGIPLGLLLGFLASFILIILSNYFLKGMLAEGIILKFEFSFASAIVAIILGIITLYFSAFKSARRAAKVSPIESIRNSSNIKIKAKKIKSSKIIQKIFGIGGEISYKNLKRNRRKYRTTVISIVVSVFVFIALSYFMNSAFFTIENELNRTDYNITLYARFENQEEYEKIIQVAQLDNIEKYSICKEKTLNIEDVKYSKEYIDTLNLNEEEAKRGYTTLITVGKEQYQEYLASLGLKESEMKQKGILIDKTTISLWNEEKNKVEKHQMRKFDYKAGDTISAELGEDKKMKVEIGCITDKYPFGLSDSNNQTLLIVSDELFDSYIKANQLNIYFLSSNANQLQDDIEKQLEDLNLNYFSVNNIQENAEMLNDLFTLMAIFLYGFITVITLIGITNIFNTITTNMELRKQEFAMLKSIGMTNNEFNKMIRLESIFMGVKSLAFGIPIGIGLSYLIYYFLMKEQGIKFQIPYVPILLAILAVFFLITILMKYSINKINKQNTIETIRNENI